jgi:hypothetical protein
MATTKVLFSLFLLYFTILLVSGMCLPLKNLEIPLSNDYMLTITTTTMQPVGHIMYG